MEKSAGKGGILARDDGSEGPIEGGKTRTVRENELGGYDLIGTRRLRKRRDRCERGP